MPSLLSNYEVALLDVDLLSLSLLSLSLALSKVCGCRGMNKSYVSKSRVLFALLGSYTS